MPRRISAPTALSYATITLVTLLFSFILLVFPYAGDDHLFMNEIFNEAPGETHSDSLTDWLGYTYSMRYHLDNARIGNSISILLLCIPRWIVMGVTCIVFLFGYLLTIKYATIRLGNWAGITFVSFLLVFVPLWHYQMFSQMFAYNYIWSLPLLIGSLLVFLRDKATAIWSAFALGLITAMWHECNAVVIIGGGAVTLLFHRNMTRHDRLMLIFGATCGLVYHITAPAWWNRGSLTSSYIQFGRLIYMWGFFIFCGLWTICLLWQPWRKICFEPRSLIMLTAGIGLTTLMLTSNRPHSAMQAMFLSAATLPWLLKRMSQESHCQLPEPIRTVIAALMLTIIVVHLVAVCIRTVEINRQSAAVEVAVANAPGRGQHVSVFVPVTYSWQAGPLTLMRPFREVFQNDHLSVTYLGLYYHRSGISLIPEQLRSYRQGMGQSLPGNGDIRLYKDCIVSPHLSDTIYIGADVSYGNYTEHAPLTHAIFTGADGADYDYIWAARSLISSFLKTPTKFNYTN